MSLLWGHDGRNVDLLVLCLFRVRTCTLVCISFDVLTEGAAICIGFFLGVHVFSDRCMFCLTCVSVTHYHVCFCCVLYICSC